MPAPEVSSIADPWRRRSLGRLEARYDETFFEARDIISFSGKDPSVLVCPAV
jgi:hypothetical protein